MNTRAKGIVEIEVLGPDGKVVAASPSFHNDILDQGLAGIASRSWAKSFEYCALGLSTADTVTSQTGLTDEFARTGLCDSSSGACGSQLTDNQLTMWRTFLFPTHVGPQAMWAEVGFSWSAYPFNNLFSRAKVPDLSGTVPITEGCRVKVKYTLVLTLSPAGATDASTTLAITGLVADSARHNWQSLCLDTIDTNGVTVSLASCMEPSSAADVFLSSVDTALSPTGDDIVSRVLAGGVSKVATVGAPALQGDGSWTVAKSATFSTSEANGQVVSSLGITARGTLAEVNGYVALLDSPFTKTVWDSLQLTFTFAWGRA